MILSHKKSSLKISLKLKEIFANYRMLKEITTTLDVEYLSLICFLFVKFIVVTALKLKLNFKKTKHVLDFFFPFILIFVSKFQ